MTSNKNQAHIDALRRRMQRVERQSPTICGAKWLQSTIYLHNGQTHSCHHPAVHAIDKKAIAKDPSALHNTSVKFKARKDMWRGKQTKECEYCWNIENLNKEHLSDRMYKSADERWAFPHLDEVEAASYKKSVVPRYLEIAFENTCNFKCAYCTPDTSSKWMEEIREHGHYPTSWGTGNLDWIKRVGKMPISRTETNPYVEAFWKWWPELLPKLKVFRITGGEPLLSKHTWRVIDEICEGEKRDLDFALNSNLNVPDKLFDRLISAAPNLTTKLRNFEIFTSCEAAGKQAEYIRYGMDYEIFFKNVERFLKETPSMTRVNFMITFNALSLTTFLDFLRAVLALRKNYNENPAFNRLPIMIAYLRWPPFLSMRILPRAIREKYAAEFRAFALEYAGAFHETNGAGALYLEEKDQLERLADFMLMDLPAKEEQRDRKDFAKFIDEYDKRKQLNFVETFPEYADFYRDCLAMAQG